METSTPLVSAANGVRRVSISVQNAPVLTPLKRNNRKSTRAKALDEFDDDLERSERRKSAALRKSLVSTDLPANTPLVLNDSVRVMSDNELKTELQLYYKMDVGNKINTRNVWNVRIIDILKLAVRREDLDTLKLGGSSLDIAGKVYGLKIDDIYTAGLKMTGNCFRNNCHGTGDDKGSDDNLDTEASGMENHQQKKKQQKKKRAIFSSGKKHMINSNPKGFLAPLTKLEAVTFSVRADTNLSATANLFTNKIRMDPAGYKFTFASKENAWGLTPGNDPTVNLETNRTFPINAKSVKSFLLCAPFKDFRTDLWDPDQENKELRTSTNTMEEVVFDEDGFPVAELDGSIHNVFEERDEQDLNNDDPIEEEINVPLVRENLEYITNFIPTEQSHAVEWSNYSYNSLITSSLGEKIQKIWAGPSHWKLKCIKPVRREVYSGRDEQRGTRKRRKCGLTEWQPVDLWNLKPPGDFIKWGKKPYKKRNCTLPAHKVLMPLLEVSCYKLLDTIDYLMTIPAMKPQKVKKQQDIDYCVTNYNYDNPGDTSYCSQRQANDVNEPDLADDIFGMDDQSCASPGFQEAAFIGDNLVDAPEMVHQKPVYYVTKAKIVDMKKLKIAIWCMLTRKDEFDFSAKVTPTSFQNVWNHLSTVLPKKMMAEVSIPMAFVAVLHLCNEHNLLLKKSDDLSNFDITGPENSQTKSSVQMKR